jgi:hypothetical protein
VLNVAGYYPFLGKEKVEHIIVSVKTDRGKGADNFFHNG